MIIEQTHNVTDSLNSVVPEDLVGICEVSFSNSIWSETLVNLLSIISFDRLVQGYPNSQL